MEDLSYLRTEYARNKMIEGYDMEMKEMESRTCGERKPNCGKCDFDRNHCQWWLENVIEKVLNGEER